MDKTSKYYIKIYLKNEKQNKIKTKATFLKSIQIFKRTNILRFNCKLRKKIANNIKRLDN